MALNPVQGATLPPHLDGADSLSPSALAASRDGATLFVACATGHCVAVLDTRIGRVIKSIPTPAPPSGLVLSADGLRLYVTCAAPKSVVCVFDWASASRLFSIAAGHTATGPVLSPDEKTLFVCDRFNNAIGVIDLAKHKEIERIPVEREPVAAAITPDGKYLLVANHLHSGRANAGVVAAKVSVIDVGSRQVVKAIALPNGSSLLR